ncbi:hypothetical protein, partial [Salinisphaera sp. Q1T1-3]|uniref:hypothetical protein n=1 Tax=Salinisphaera sp. Q1T1-3 TaxID=2321229 RepID=UPI001F263428
MCDSTRATASGREAIENKGTSDLFIYGRAGVFCARLTSRRERRLLNANERAATPLRRAQKPGR